MTDESLINEEVMFRFKDIKPIMWPIDQLLFLNLSKGRDTARYRIDRAIKDLGLFRHPLAAMTEAKVPVILSGTRRVNSLIRLGYDKVPIILIPPMEGEETCYAHPDNPEARLYPFQIVVAIMDNLHRGYNPAETIAAGSLLHSLPPSLYKERLLTYLDLTAPKLLEEVADSSKLPENILSAFAAGHLDTSDINGMMSFTREEKIAIYELFIRLRPSRQKRKQWIESLDDIKARDHRDIAAFLRDEFSIFDSFDKEERARDKLFSLRFPKLAKVLENRKEFLKTLKLPKGVSLILDDTLEDQGVVLRIDFSSPENLRDQLIELQAKLENFERLSILFSNNWNT
jgi:hypothetical protein